MASNQQPTPLNLYDTSFRKYREHQSSPETSESAEPNMDNKKPAPSSPPFKYSNIHFLEREPVMPAYTMPANRAVKIKPLDKELVFDGTNMTIEKFIRRYQVAGEADGTSPRDLARQIISFIKGPDLKD